MNYPVYFLLSLTASCAAATALLGALWLLAPALGARFHAGKYQGKDRRAPAAGPPAPQSAPEPPDKRITFSARREQLPALAEMLRGETPDNVAIVLSRLPPPQRPALLSLLDRELGQQALISLAAVKFVDDEMLSVLKEEIEKRLDTVVGGPGEAVALINSHPYAERKDLLARLEAGGAQFAREARALIVLDEDLLALSGQETAALAAALPPELLAEVFHGLPDKLRYKLKEQLDARTLALVEKAAPEYSPSKQKQEVDLERFMGAVAGLIDSGRLPKPAVRAKPAPPAPKSKTTGGNSGWE